MSRNAQKQLKKLDQDVITISRLLANDLSKLGTAPGKKWANYGKLCSGKQVDKRHCHLSRGKPTYVCCWRVLCKRTKQLEVYYVGTHEKAPY